MSKAIFSPGIKGALLIIILLREDTVVKSEKNAIIIIMQYQTQSILSVI